MAYRTLDEYIKYTSSEKDIDRACF